MMMMNKIEGTKNFIEMAKIMRPTMKQRQGGVRNFNLFSPLCSLSLSLSFYLSLSLFLSVALSLSIYLSLFLSLCLSLSR